MPLPSGRRINPSSRLIGATRPAPRHARTGPQGRFRRHGFSRLRENDWRWHSEQECCSSLLSYNRIFFRIRHINSIRTTGLVHAIFRAKFPRRGGALYQAPYALTVFHFAITSVPSLTRPAKPVIAKGGKYQAAEVGVSWRCRIDGRWRITRTMGVMHPPEAFSAEALRHGHAAEAGHSVQHRAGDRLL